MNWSWQTPVLAMAHSLWQSAIAAAALWVLLRLLPASRANLRYLAAVAAMAMCLLAAMATWSVLDAKSPVATAPAAPISAAGVADSGPPASMTRATDSPAPDPAEKSSISWSTLLGWTWLAGAALMLLRIGAGIASAGRLVRTGRPLTTGPLAKAVADIADKLRLHRPIRILLHDHWPIPAVVGCLRPALLLPASIATDCPAWQLQIILAHELAHIRRFDFLINICQQVIEAVLFFNPAVWWITHQIRIEREACCDAVAVRLTGSPQQAAQTLADFSSRLFAPTAAMALVGRSRGGGQLLDRIRRIILPSARPWISAPWYGAAIAIVAAVMTFAALHVGADKAVATVQDLFVSPESIARIAAVQQTMPPAETADDGTHPHRIVTVHGTLRTADGSPLPRNTDITVFVRDGHGSELDELPAQADGTFSMPVGHGRTWILAEVPGFAPLVSAPAQPDKSDKLPAFDLVLQRGFSARVLLVGPGGKPIPGAAVQWSVKLDNGSLGIRDITSGRDGYVRFAHASAVPLQFAITAPGYEYDEEPVTLAPHDQTIVLTPAALTTGTIRDGQTGNPIAGAAIKMVCRHNDAGSWTNSPFDNESGYLPLAARTDSGGKFTLNSLRRDSQYTFIVRVRGYGTLMVQHVTAGQANVRWTLNPPVVIPGRITGDLSRLDRRRGRPVLHISQCVDVSEHDDYCSSSEPLAVKTANGVGTFEIRDPLPGEIDIQLPDHVLRLRTDHLPPVITIDIPRRGDLPKVTMRTVVFAFDVPKCGPSPEGTLRVWPATPGAVAADAPVEVPVKEGVAKMQAAVGKQLQYSGDGRLLGYWARPGENIAVPAGKTPLVIHVPVVPAGAVSGHVLEPDGSPSESFAVSVVQLKRSPLVGGSFPNIDSFNSKDGSGAFLITPIPMGGKYRLVAQSGARIVAGPAITFDAEHTLRETTLRFPEGVPVQVDVVDADGRPRRGVQIELNFNMPMMGFGAGGTFTGRDGVAVFQHVNSQGDGSYAVEIKPGDDYPGQTVPIHIDGKPIRITLARGLTLAGVVIDDTTGKPMAGAVVHAHAEYEPNTPFRQFDVKTVTDGQGRFAFHNLDQGDCRIIVEHADPAGTVRQKLPDGRTSVSWPNNLPTYRAGPGEAVVHVVPNGE